MQGRGENVHEKVEICQENRKNGQKFPFWGGKCSQFVAVKQKCHEIVPQTFLFCGGESTKLFR